MTIFKRKNMMFDKERVQPDFIMIGLWLSLLLVAIIWLIPFIFIVFTSLKSQGDLFNNLSFMPPKVFRVDNYVEAWEEGTIGRFGLNSLIICLIKVPIAILLSTAAAFALTRLKFRYQKLLLSFIILGAMLPVQIALGPLFRMMLDLKLLNNYAGVILPYIAFGIPYDVFLLRGFFSTIPMELDEAARIDGCSNFTLYWRIILPLSLPILAALFILDFVSTWNEFSIALVILQAKDTWTIPLGLQGFQGQFSSNFQLLNAAIVIGILPVIIVYLIFQRYFVAGLTSGALKG
jgi:raffinose/stachyose/melibiose transport system permease protein